MPKHNLAVCDAEMKKETKKMHTAPCPTHCKKDEGAWLKNSRLVLRSRARGAISKRWSRRIDTVGGSSVLQRLKNGEAFVRDFFAQPRRRRFVEVPVR